MGTKSQALMGNQRAVRPETNGATGARRALTTGRFSARMERKIARYRARIESGEIDDILAQGLAEYASVADELQSAVKALGNGKARRSKRFLEYISQWNTIKANTMRFGFLLRAIQKESDGGTVDAVVSKYQDRAENA